MDSTSWLWRALSAVTLACFLLLLAGFGWALKDHWIPSAGMALPESELPPAASKGVLADKPEWKVAALGDSLTVGTGDATGEGYVKRVVAGLSDAADKPVRLVNNLAYGGLTAERLLPMLDDTGLVNAVRQADIILFTIGGNDLFQLASGGGTMTQGSELSPEEMESKLPEAEQRLAAVMQKLREINPAGRIVYVGLYNPFYDLNEMRPASAHIQRWNAFAHELAAADGNATVVPTFDLFEANIAAYISSDHFHPNEAGYARIAERVVQAIQ